jgi:hypothetical protein
MVMVVVGEVGVVVVGRQHLLFVDDAKSSISVCRRSSWVWPYNNNVYLGRFITFKQSHGVTVILCSM